MSKRFLVLFLLLGLSGSGAFAHGSSRSGSSSSHAHATGRSSKAVHDRGYTKNGRIKRSVAAKDAFLRETGYPHGRKGYVVDHVVPLACGGADTPSNMQWQTKADAKAKDRTERVGCK
jgi:hypothetical protein